MKAGDKVVCIHKGAWVFISDGKATTGPKENEIVTIEKVHSNGRYYLFGYNKHEYGRTGREKYLPKWFAPIQDNFAEETLAKAKEQQKDYNIPTIDPATREPIKI